MGRFFIAQIQEHQAKSQTEYLAIIEIHIQSRK